MGGWRIASANSRAESFILAVLSRHHGVEMSTKRLTDSSVIVRELHPLPSKKRCFSRHHNYMERRARAANAPSHGCRQLGGPIALTLARRMS
jgi:hypothetical protein